MAHGWREKVPSHRPWCWYTVWQAIEATGMCWSGHCPTICRCCGTTCVASGVHRAGRREFSHSDDLIAVLDAQGIDRTVLVGVSMGGAIVVNTALNHPDRVSGLVLISPALTAWRWSRDWRARWKDVATLVQAGDIDGARDLWWTHPHVRCGPRNPGRR